MTFVPGYTPQQARALENHYIAGYIQEGIWNSQKLVKPIIRGEDAPNTKRERMKINQMNQGREAVHKAVAAGCKTVHEIRKRWPRSETAVRRYLRELEAMERVEAIGQTGHGAVIWRATTP
jgi:Fic family protein